MRYSCLKLSVFSTILLLCKPLYASFEVDGIMYEVIPGVNLNVEVVKNSKKYSGDVVVPDYIIYDGKTYYVTKIDYYAFAQCSNLTSVTIGNNVTDICGYSFWNCDNLTTLTIGRSTPRTIPSNVFEGCNKLSTLNFNCETIEKWFSGMKSIKKVVIGDNVTNIDDYAFSNCDGLTTVILGNNVKTICAYAFSGCVNICSIDIPNSVKDIRNRAFMGCRSLTSITIPDGVETIGNQVFLNCGDLSSIIIGSGITQMGTHVFYGCEKLTSVFVNGRDIAGWWFQETPIEDAILGDNVETIGFDAFFHCKQLKTVTMGKNVKTIRKEAFNSCSSLSSITFKSCPIEIHHQAFWRCSTIKTCVFHCKEVYPSINCIVTLEEIVLGDEVTSISDNAFSGCNRLSSVASESMTPPNLKENAFNDETYENATLYVPRGSLTLYSQHQYWKKFKKIVEKDTSGINTVRNDTDKAERIYNLSGKLQDAGSTVLPKGIYIKNRKKVITK